MPENKTVILITGPTASGKTSVAIELAKLFDTEIISADSRQCFRELNIGVAKPTDEQLQIAKHYFINSHSIHDKVNAAVFETYALHIAQQIFLKNNIAILVGGTGLYIKAFCEGMDLIPQIPKKIKEGILKKYEADGIHFLQKELEKNDPTFIHFTEKQNPQRLMRALEVLQATGKPISYFYSLEKKKRDFNIIKFGIELSKEKLHQNINERTDEMMRMGLEKEALELYQFEKLNALQTVGYKELFEFFQNKTSLKNAVEQIKINTRHYAKRQLTWFKKDKEIQWLTAENIVSEAENLFC